MTEIVHMNITAAKYTPTGTADHPSCPPIYANTICAHLHSVHEIGLIAYVT